MRAVRPHSVLQVPLSDNRGGQILLDAIARLPAHHVELGTDRSQLIATLEGVFEQYG